MRAGFDDATLGKTGYWYQEPKSWNIESKMSKNLGRHYMKVGGEYRKENVDAARPRPMSFDFGPRSRPNTYNAPNTDSQRRCVGEFPARVHRSETRPSVRSPFNGRESTSSASVFHDDFKITPNLTLNLGLRYEYFTAMRIRRTVSRVSSI